VRFVVFAGEGRVADAEAVVEVGFGVFAADVVDTFVVVGVAEVDFVGRDADYGSFWAVSKRVG
jgi:hypothetical protein